MDNKPQANPYAPPTAHVADVRRPEDGQELASRWTRFGAGLIDFIVMMAVLWIVSKATPWNPLDFSAEPSLTRLLTNAVFGFTLFMLINGWLLVQRGQTVGKLATRIRITRPDGAKASPVRVLLARYGVGQVLAAIPVVGGLYGLADCAFVFRESRRCIHDLIADTIVVKA